MDELAAIDAKLARLAPALKGSRPEQAALVLLWVNELLDQRLEVTSSNGRSDPAYTMSDGEVVTANVSSEHNHADALDELATRATRILKEALTDIFSIHRAMSELDNEDDSGEPEVTV